MGDYFYEPDGNIGCNKDLWYAEKVRKWFYWKFLTSIDFKKRKVEKVNDAILQIIAIKILSVAWNF
jgi:hypothetical protein